MSGFLKLVSPKAKASKILFGHIKPINPSVQMAYKGQSSFGIIAILNTYLACKTLFGPINLPIHQSKWPIKVSTVSESMDVFNMKSSEEFAPFAPLLNF